MASCPSPRPSPVFDTGTHRVRLVEAGEFRLDGGAMFGSVPRVLWGRHHAPDGDNRIRLATRLLWVEETGADGGSGRRVLVDVGNGDKFDARTTGLLALRTRPVAEWGVPVESVTDVVLTHLHFDHAGGITRRAEDGRLEPSFPAASIHVQEENWLNARDPWDRERASYLPENILPLEGADLHLREGPGEILPGIHAGVAHGHTRGLQWLLIGEGEGAIAYPSDLVPTASHLHLPWIMGYDRCAETTHAEKKAFLERAADEGWIVVFEHDPEVAAVTVKLDSRGRFAVDEVVA